MLKFERRKAYKICTATSLHVRFTWRHLDKSLKSHNMHPFSALSSHVS